MSDTGEGTQRAVVKTHDGPARPGSDDDSARPDSGADGPGSPPRPVRPTDSQRRWLRRGLDQPGGKLPLFDENGRRVDSRVVRACLAQGWAEPWFANPLKPDWLVCKLTEAGRAVVSTAGRPAS
ncbi:hypothetical protein ROR02_07660 [Pararhodospirillum oryzae]|uniref:Uncharacterized protein n=1 Tax=Pararhodospirillum oryzae TaxID=478448 RepID=A0A512H582_9PROT|nr:hypothetical protein ROR02_07660 [Pararhodospirillum oryzae]